MTDETKKKLVAGITITIGAIGLYFAWRQYSLSEQQAQAAQNASDAAALQQFQDAQGQQGENLVGLGGGGEALTGASGATGSTLAETIASLDTALGLTPTTLPAPTTTTPAVATAAVTLQPTSSSAAGYFEGNALTGRTRAPIQVAGVFDAVPSDSAGNAAMATTSGPLPENS